jgi:hypothetical protein
MLVKIYGPDPAGEKRYSPADCIGVCCHFLLARTTTACYDANLPPVAANKPSAKLQGGGSSHPTVKMTGGEKIHAQACHSSFDIRVPCQLAGDVMGGPV